MASQFGVIKERYALEEIIGSGGMGVVYRAADQVLGRTVAVKMIRAELVGEEFVQRFEREAAILARLRSPHIVVVYDYGKHDDEFFMVTDFLVEGDLAGWLESNGPMPPAGAVPLMSKLSEGLADAHQAGVLHRDIKPANVLLWTRGGRLQPVLADFGIAVTSDLTLTKTGEVVGSPLYMAPERHLGDPATVASDIYAMGCLLYAVLTGRPPFWGGTEFQAANAHLNDPIPELPAALPFASELDAIIATCMAKQPADRLASAEELAGHLDRLARRMSVPEEELVPPPVPAGPGSVQERTPTGETTVLSPTVPPPKPMSSPEPQPTSARSRTFVVIGGVIALAAALGVGGWWVTASHEEPSDPTAGAGGSSLVPPESSSPPSAPDAPSRASVRAESGDLEVVFRTEVPPARGGVTYEVERRDAGSWEPARAQFAVPTEVGGAEECATVRLVAVNEVGRTPGAERKVCKSSRPPDLDLIPVDADCVYLERVCTFFQLVVEGFQADTTVVVECSVDDPTATFETAQRLPHTDEQGRAAIETYDYSATEHWPGAFQIDDANNFFYCRAGGGEEVWTFDLAKLRADAGR